MTKVREACGLFGVAGVDHAVDRTYYGLFALQHRGQESAGIAVSEGVDLRGYKGMGLVVDVFSETVLRRLQEGVSGPAIGHVRYSTTGSSHVVNAQPLIVRSSRGPLAVAHNGNLVNSDDLRTEFEAHGSIFQTTTDSEVILHLLARPSPLSWERWLAQCLRQIRGAYSLLLLTPNEVIAVRDPHGFRPLSLGRLEGGHVVASETCAFDLVGAEDLGEVKPGEMVFLGRDGSMRRVMFAQPGASPHAHCIFEHVYFARPDSRVFGDTAQTVRERLGENLARECGVEADLVLPVPDSGNAAAIGYARASGIPLGTGFIRNHYVGRTFIQPTPGQRTGGVRVKLNVVPGVLRGRRVVVVDDSIIRGTTSGSRMQQLRQAGVREIHLRIASPPVRHPCYYGIDFPTRTELVAARHTDVEGIAREIRVDSLGYVSLEGLLGAVGRPPADYCTACFSGCYPVPVDARTGKYVHEAARSNPVRSGASPRETPG